MSATAYIKRSDIVPGDLLGGPRLCVTAAFVWDEVILQTLFCDSALLETSASKENAVSALLTACASKRIADFKK